MSSSINTKKRRVGGDTPANSDDNELIAIKSSIDELVHQNRTQNDNIEKLVHQNRTQNENISNMCQLMKGMQDDMKGMQSEMKDMRGEITKLRKRCDGIEKVQKDIKSSIDNNDMSGRFDKVENNLKYHEVLLKSQKWEYPSSSLTVSYLDSIGADQRDEVEELLRQIQKYTEEMRYGTSDGDITLDINEVEYNEELLPHWKEFATALEQYKYNLSFLPKDNKSMLQLIGMELSDSVVELLSKALKSTNFRHVLFDDNNFGDKGIDFALNYLKSNDECKEFALRDNVMGMQDIEELCDIISSHISLQMLVLYNCKGVDVNSYEMLKSVMTAGKFKLETLYLSDNDISTEGDTFLANFLAKNPILETLDVTRNELDDTDARAIALALKHNTNLLTLNICRNNLTSEGWKALSKAVFDKTSLNTAADSNHICDIDFPDDDNEYEDVRNINGDDSPVIFYQKYIRRKKIYTILSARNRSLSNVDHFDEDMPIELLPDVMRSIEKYSNYHVHTRAPQQGSADVNPLSIMFEILQRWDKSLAVFEALSS